MTTLPVLDPEALPTTGIAMLDFGAARCAPCRAMEPLLEALAEEYRERARIFVHDCDRDPVTAARFGVRSMPTLVVLRDGHEVGRIVGARPRSFVAGVLDRALAGDVAITAP